MPGWGDARGPESQIYGLGWSRQRLWGGQENVPTVPFNVKKFAHLPMLIPVEPLICVGFFWPVTCFVSGIYESGLFCFRLRWTKISANPVSTSTFSRVRAHLWRNT